MRKRLVAYRAESSKPYEVTMDDQPLLSQDSLARALINEDSGPVNSNSTNKQEGRDQEVPAEVQMAVVAGDFNQAKNLLEKAGYTVEVHDLDEPAQA